MTNEVSDRVIGLIQNKLWIKVSSCETYASLHFNEPSTRNAIGAETAEALAELILETKKINSTHPFASLLRQRKLVALFLRSEVPGVFLSGGNLKAITTFTMEQGRNFTEQMRVFTEFLRAGPLVSIAVLNGIASGGGSEIALACDLRVSTGDKVQIDLAQARWGVPAGWGMMSDLRLKAVFGSERRRGIAIASQETWELEKLETLGLIDARFEKLPDQEHQFLNWASKLIQKLSICPADLRTELIIERPQSKDASLAEFDKTLFSRYWMGDEHLGRLNGFLAERRASKQKDEHS